MKRLFALAVISTLALTGCGKSDFDNNAEKEEAFAAYTCKKSLESPVEQENQAVATAIKVLADENALPAEKEKALNLQLKHMGSINVPSEPLTMTLDGETCEGWVWKQYLKYEKRDHFDSFTYQEAKDSGIYE